MLFWIKDGNYIGDYINEKVSNRRKNPPLAVTSPACSVVNSRGRNILKEMNTLSPGDWDIW